MEERISKRDVFRSTGDRDKTISNVHDDSDAEFSVEDWIVEEGNNKSGIPNHLVVPGSSASRIPSHQQRSVSPSLNRIKYSSHSS